VIASGRLKPAAWGGQSRGAHASGGESRGEGAQHRPGNFAEDREKASEAGSKGGHTTHHG